MSGEAPTTVGSIVGKLSLDKAQWDRDVAEAKADARSLGEMHPTIKVDADVAEALAKLDEVRAAEARSGGDVTSRVNTVYTSTSIGGGPDSKRLDSSAAAAKRLEDAQARLAAAERVSANAASALEIAEMRVQAVQDKRGRTDLQVATAQSQLSRAVLAVEAADQRHDKAIRDVTAAQNDLTKSTESVAAATEHAAAANQGNLGYLGLIAVGIAALIPLAAPLTGFLLGTTAALAGMGAAGVLAFEGIKAEMAADTDLGNQYQDSIAQVKDDLHQLEATAAAGVIKPFNDAIAYLQPQMPRLNQDMGAMASWLGKIAATSVQTVVAGFEQLEPLMVAGEKVLASWASNMALFAASPQFRAFIQYAIGQLPQVNNLLINLAGMVIHVVDAFTPLGTAIIPLLSAIAWGFNAIPTPVLTALAAGAGAVAVSFAAWNFVIEPLMAKLGLVGAEAAGAAVGAEALGAAGEVAAAGEAAAAGATTAWGAALDFATGPVGIIIGLVAAIAGGMFTAASATEAAAKAQADFTAAIQADNGAIRQHVAASAAKQLADQGAYDLAKKLGVSTDQVTSAVLGQGGAYKSLTARLQEVVDTSWKHVGAGKATTLVQTEQGKTAQSLLGIVKNLNGGLKDQIKTQQEFAGAAVQAGDAAQALAQDQNILDDASKSADAATQGFIDSLDKYGKSAGTAADKGAFLGASLVAMQGDWLSYTGAIANANYANFTLTQTFKDQGKEVSQGVKFLRDTEKAAIDLNTGLIDVTKSGAPALISQLQGMQSAAEKAAAATYQHEVATKGAGQAAADAATVFKGATYDALVKDADQLGITADQAKKLADRYFGLPSDVITKLQVEGQSTIVQTLDGIGQQLAELTHHPWTSTLDANGVPLSHEAYLAQLRLDQIKQLKPADIKADAAKAHMTVDDFTKALQNIPNKDVTITAETAAAEANLLAVKAHIDALQSKVVTMTVVTNNVGAPAQLPANPGGGRLYGDGGTIHAALGMTVPGPRHPYGDRVPALLAPSEEVISNRHGQATANRSLLKAVNAGASPSQIADLAARMAGVKSVGGDHVTNNVTHNWTVVAADPSQLTSSVAMRMNSLGIA